MLGAIAFTLLIAGTSAGPPPALEPPSAQKERELDTAPIAPVQTAPRGDARLPVALAQTTAGAAVCCAAYFPGAVVGGWLWGPYVAALVQTYVGDRLGRRRGAVLWPMAASYLTGATTVGLAALILTGITAGGYLANQAGAGDRAAQGALLAFSLTGLTAGLVASLTAATASTITYQLTSVQKRAGDGGAGLPGFLRPHHQLESPRLDGEDLAMAY